MLKIKYIEIPKKHIDPPGTVFMFKDKPFMTVKTAPYILDTYVHAVDLNTGALTKIVSEHIDKECSVVVAELNIFKGQN